jgi:hypothetical protein
LFSGVVLGLPALSLLGAVAGGVVIWLNREFLHSIRIHEGRSKALAAIPLLWLELLVAGVGGSFGILSFLFGSRY